jgi:hypothetical protein
VETRFCYDSTGEPAEAGMAGFIQGVDRGQSTLLPECLEDWADESNAVRVIDAFVDGPSTWEIPAIVARLPRKRGTAE